MFASPQLGTRFLTTAASCSQLYLSSPLLVHERSPDVFSLQQKILGLNKSDAPLRPTFAPHPLPTSATNLTSQPSATSRHYDFSSFLRLLPYCSYLRRLFCPARHSSPSPAVAQSLAARRRSVTDAFPCMKCTSSYTSPPFSPLSRATRSLGTAPCPFHAHSHPQTSDSTAQTLPFPPGTPSTPTSLLPPYPFPTLGGTWNPLRSYPNRRALHPVRLTHPKVIFLSPHNHPSKYNPTVKIS